MASYFNISPDIVLCITLLLNQGQVHGFILSDIDCNNFLAPDYHFECRNIEFIVILIYIQENTSKSPEDDIPSEVDWSVNTSLAKFKVK